MKEDRWTVSLRIEHYYVLRKMNTGANCSVISVRLLKMLITQKITKCVAALSTFFGHAKRAIGKIALQLTSSVSSMLEEFYVVREGVPTTLSGSLCEKLGLLRRVERERFVLLLRQCLHDIW